MRTTPFGVQEKLLYVNEITENVKTEKKLEEAMDHVSEAYDNHDLTNSMKKIYGKKQPST